MAEKGIESCVDDVDDYLMVKKLEGLICSSYECCPWKIFTRPGPINLMKWKWMKDNLNLPTGAKLNEVLPVEKPHENGKISDPPENKVQITWLGHATVLVQFDGISILTDPVFEMHCGPSIPIDKIKYARYRPAPCDVSDLKKVVEIDAVMISHNHYDHLEVEAVKKINHEFPNVKWFVASGQKDWMIRKGVNGKNVVELEWWQQYTLSVKDKPFKFVCVPSQHWCQRGPLDFNKVLWCSWVVKGPTKSFYFGGDTGYNKKLFETIGKKFGPFDLAAIPIGAYEPRFITEFQHVDPAEAVNIHEDIKSKQSIGIHWGTFPLTNEFFVEPPQKLEEELIKKEIDPSKFFCINHGETWTAGDKYKERLFMTYKAPEATNDDDKYDDDDDTGGARGRSSL